MAYAPKRVALMENVMPPSVAIVPLVFVAFSFVDGKTDIAVAVNDTKSLRACTVGFRQLLVFTFIH